VNVSVDLDRIRGRHGRHGSAEIEAGGAEPGASVAVGAATCAEQATTLPLSASAKTTLRKHAMNGVDAKRDPRSSP
jgi:hypothetical protein